MTVGGALRGAGLLYDERVLPVRSSTPRKLRRGLRTALPLLQRGRVWYILLRMSKCRMVGDFSCEMTCIYSELSIAAPGATSAK